MTEFGLRFVRRDCDEAAWWQRVADQMEGLVSAHVPAGARSVGMTLDSDNLEVVLEYDTPGLRVVGRS